MKSASVRAFVAIGTSLLLGQACSNPFSNDTVELLEVTEVQVPATVPSTGRLTVTLNVGVGGCQEFDRITANRSSGLVVLSAYGITHTGRNVGCPDILKLEVHTYEITGPFTDPLTISVNRPRQEPLVRTVRIQ